MLRFFNNKKEDVKASKETPFIKHSYGTWPDRSFASRELIPANDPLFKKKLTPEDYRFGNDETYAHFGRKVVIKEKLICTDYYLDWLRDMDAYNTYKENAYGSRKPLSVNAGARGTIVRYYKGGEQEYSGYKSLKKDTYSILLENDDVSIVIHDVVDDLFEMTK
ncbi:MAG TPA: hypothetical protein VMW42_02125 [Desulfatiglandales bacterium]|nr:hypothetical protein [Desulfatiglandales bacterium]